MKTLNESQVEWLLDELCVKLGFCLPPEAYQRLKAEPPRDIERFADAVFKAERMDPRDHPHLREQVVARVAACFDKARRDS